LLIRRSKAAGLVRNTCAYRNQTGRIAARVCCGLAEYFNIDVTLIRILFVVLTVFGGAGLVLYLAMWMLIPDARKAPPGMGG
jgi:phage shock protein C